MLNKHLTTNDILQCNGSPIDNNLMPEYVGQLCIDITNELIYIAKTLNENGWITVASSAEGDDSNINELYETTATLSNILGNTELQTEEKTVTAAINELFQSANNGKELIANAIGEPLSKDKTFSAMSTDINNLVSSFKSILINAGVAVNSDDKFKQLIDKIKNMFKDNEEKYTALLDSLKSILNDEGVATTDSDTIDDLIVKVDEEFARKNAQGIKINCVSTLPTTPVENQIVVITPNVPSVKEIKDYNDCVPTSNGQVIIGASTTNNSGSMVPYSITTNGVVLNLYLVIAKGQFNNTLETYDGYIGRDGSWIQFSTGAHTLYANGYDAIGFTITNNWSYSSTRIYFSNTSTSIDLKMKIYNGGWIDEYAYFKKPIDLTNVRQVRIVGSYYNNGATYSGVGFVASNNFTTGPTWARKIYLTKSVEEVITDVSSLKGSYYFGTVNRCDGTARNAMKITEFELIY